MRKKQADKLLNDLGKLFLATVLIAFAMYYFSDKAKFWTVAVIGFLLFLLAGVLIVVLQRRRFKDIYNWNSDRELLNRLKNLHPDEFESFVSDLFSKLGYRTEKVGGRNDGGIDVIATKDGKRHFIQCKRFSNSEVSVGSVRDFYGALADKVSNAKGYFITTNKFTLEAERFAEDKPIELIDGHRFLEYIHQAKIDEIPETAEHAPRVCPDCGNKLVLRQGRYGKFYGCSNFPKCKHTEN
jgi:restriction system protein